VDILTASIVIGIAQVIIVMLTVGSAMSYNSYAGPPLFALFVILTGILLFIIHAEVRQVVSLAYEHNLTMPERYHELIQDRKVEAYIKTLNYTKN